VTTTWKTCYHDPRPAASQQLGPPDRPVRQETAKQVVVLNHSFRIKLLSLALTIFVLVIISFAHKDINADTLAIKTPIRPEYVFVY
jgi:hypothetical protein